MQEMTPARSAEAAALSSVTQEAPKRCWSAEASDSFGTS